MMLRVSAMRAGCVRAAAAAAVLVPFGLSLAAHVLPVTPVASAALPRPPLAFSEHLINRGLLDEGQPAGATFRFRNMAATPLKIIECAASCGCLTPVLDKDSYDPGEAGRFLLKADTAGTASDREASIKEHYVDVRYDAGHGIQSERVHLKFSLSPRRVTVEPRAMTVYQLTAEPTERSVTITDRRTPPLNVVGVESASPQVQATVTVANVDAAGAADPQRASVTVRVPHPPTKPVRTLLMVHTDDSRQPIIYIPINVFGPGSDSLPSSASPLTQLPHNTVQ